jgi:hypothetical protein
MTTSAEATGHLARLWRYLPEVLILTLAAATRLWRLDYHSFWFDEAVSLDWAEDGPGFIWQSTFALVKDKHPPGYYLLLHSWQNLLEFFGLAQDDVALRALGALLGVLTVLALLLLARRLSGRSTALLAAVLAALAPVLVWYSQELRMFQPATTGLVWAAYCLVRGWQGESRRARLGWWLGMVGAFTFALYSYLFSALVLPAAGLTLVALWVWEHLQDRRRKEAEHALPPQPQAPISNLSTSRIPREAAKETSFNLAASRPRVRKNRELLNLHSLTPRFLEGVVALAVTGLVFLPLARNAWLVNAGEGAPGQAFMNFWGNLQRQLQIFTIWRAPWSAEIMVAAVVFFAVLVAVGLLLPWPRAPRFLQTASGIGLDQVWLLLWLGAPLLIGNLLLATSDTVFKEDRYFLFLAPFVLWAAARGGVALGARWRPAAWGLGGVAVLLLATALPVLWSPAMLREDWRAAAQYIAAYQRASPGLPGAVFSHADYTHKALKWYLRPLADETAAPIYFPYGGVLTAADGESIVAPPVRGMEAEGAATLWLVQSHLEGVDDARVVQNWLGANYPVITEQFPTGIQVTGYALQHRFSALPSLRPDAALLDAGLAPNLRLLACEVMTPATAATETRLHPPSGWVHVRMWWQADGAIDQDYFPSVQMVGSEGVWGERLYRDGEALRRDPPSQWPAGIIVRDEVDVNLNPVTPPGRYPIVVGLRDAAGVDVGDKVECGWVVIE